MLFMVTHVLGLCVVAALVLRAPSFSTLLFSAVWLVWGPGRLVTQRWEVRAVRDCCRGKSTANVSWMSWTKFLGIKAHGKCSRVISQTVEFDLIYRNSTQTSLKQSKNQNVQIGEFVTNCDKFWDISWAFPYSWDKVLDTVPKRLLRILKEFSARIGI